MEFLLPVLISLPSVWVGYALSERAQRKREEREGERRRDELLSWCEHFAEEIRKSLAWVSLLSPESHHVTHSQAVLRDLTEAMRIMLPQLNQVSEPELRDVYLKALWRLAQFVHGNPQVQLSGGFVADLKTQVSPFLARFNLSLDSLD